MAIRIIKRQPKQPYHSYDVAATKTEALKIAQKLSKTKCGVVVWDYGKKGVPVSSGRTIKYAVMYLANQGKCKAKK